MNLTKEMSDKEVARWEKVRAKGKMFFVLRTSIIFSLSIAILTALLNWLLTENTHFTPFNLIFLIVMSPFIGLINWWAGDARYQNHILDKKISDGLKL